MNVCNMINVTKDAKPKLTSGTQVFKEQIDENGLYWGIPEKYFNVEGDDVYMSSNIAHLFDWNIDEIRPTFVNVNTYAQRVEIDGKKYSVNPGAFCSDIKKENIIDEI